MSWIYLFFASVFEVVWTLAFKMATTGGHKILWLLFGVVIMMTSGYLLYLAQKQIPIGTAYAIWTGIGVIGAFLLGTLFFKETASVMRITGVLLIISGIVLLKLYN